MFCRLGFFLILSGLLPVCAWAQPSLCRLRFSDVCEPVTVATRLSERQKEFFREWVSRYATVQLDGEALVLAFSDLPQAIRHEIFLEDGRPLAQVQVRERLLALSPVSKGHPVLERILAAMPRSFGNEGRFYGGLERAIHLLLVSNPGTVAMLRKEIGDALTKASMEETKTPPAPPLSAPAPRETARVD